jgi:hypothetical protein
MFKKIFSFFRRNVPMAGEITASAGIGSVSIPVRGVPLVILAFYTHALPPPGCGPIVVDDVAISAVRLRRILPIYALKIDWNIRSGNTRDITWTATVRQ